MNAQFEKFLELIARNDIDNITNLVALGFNTRQYEDYALAVAAQYNRVKILKLLISLGANIHANEDRAFRTAIINDSIPAAKILLRSGANIHAKNDEALQDAVVKKKLKLIMFLLSIGARPNEYTIKYIVRQNLDKVIQVFQEIRPSRALLDEIKKQGKEYLLSTESIKPGLTLVDTLSFLTFLKAEEVKLSLCDINSSNYIVKSTNSKLLKKDSSSDAINVFTNIIAQQFSLPISLKIFINSPNTTGLVYEAKLYREILQRIVQYKYSPNFVSYVGFAECDVESLLNYADNEERKMFAYKITQIFPRDVKICMLATERVGNGAMFGYNEILPVYTLETLMALLENQEERDNIMFQICYSLHLMQEFKIVHNDMHGKNVLVMILPQKTKMCFTIGGKTYVVNTRYIPYLFDWDFGYMDALGVNEYTVQFPFIFNKFSKKADLYTLLCTLDVFINKDMAEFFQKYPDASLKETSSPIDLTEEELKQIQEYQIFANGDGSNIYKFSYAQFREIFPSIYISPDVVHIFIAVFPSKLLAEIYSGHQCRQTTISKAFPTPLEYIEKYLSQLERDPEEIKNEKFHNTYSIPTSTELIIENDFF